MTRSRVTMIVGDFKRKALKNGSGRKKEWSRLFPLPYLEFPVSGFIRLILIHADRLVEAC